MSLRGKALLGALEICHLEGKLRVNAASFHHS